MMRLLPILLLLWSVTGYAQVMLPHRHPAPRVATPPLPDGISLRWVASDLNSSPVSVWADRVQGIVWNQPTASLQPTWNTNGVWFDGSQWLYATNLGAVSTPPINTTTNAILCVLAFDDLTALQSLVFGNALSGGNILLASGTSVGKIVTGATAQSGNVDNFRLAVLMCKTTNATNPYRVYTNGVQTSASAAATSTMGTFTYVGADVGNAAYWLHSFVGSIQEFVVWTNVTLTDADIAKVQTYVSSTYPANPYKIDLANGLASYWRMDESTNASRADEVGGMTLSVSGSVGSLSGMITNAAYFNASSSYLTHADSSTLSVPLDTPFTVACWTKLDSTASDYTMVSKGATAGADCEYVLVFITSGTRIYVICGNGTTTQSTADTTTTVATNQWRLALGTYAASNLWCYVDAGYGNKAVMAHGSHDTSNPFLIGRRTTSSGNMNGLVDEVGLWKRKLNAGERSVLWNSGSGKTYPFTP